MGGGGGSLFCCCAIPMTTVAGRVTRRRNSLLVPTGTVVPTNTISIPTPSPRSNHDEICYSCLEGEIETKKLLKCPTCTASVHVNCLVEFELIRGYGSLKNFYDQVAGSGTVRTFGSNCPLGHRLIVNARFNVKREHTVGAPSGANLLFALVNFMLLCIFIGSTTYVPVHYYFPLALPFAAVGAAMFATTLTLIPIERDPTFYETALRLETFAPALFFASHAILCAVHSAHLWIKLGLPLLLILSSTLPPLGFALFILLTPLIWTIDLQMMDWLSPWLIEQCAIYLVGLVLSCYAVGNCVSLTTTYRLLRVA